MAVLDGPAGRVNPARAGMIRHVAISRYTYDGKPRASGDDPAIGVPYIWGGS